MSWLDRARGLNNPEREQKALKFSNAWRHRIELNKESKDILIVKGSWPSSVQGAGDLPFWETKKHYFYDPHRTPKPMFRSFMCAKSLNKNACSGCEYQFSKRDKRFTLRNVNIWPVVHLDWYYRVVNEYGDAPYYVQPETRSEEREFDSSEYHTKVFGKPGFIELGRAHQEQFLDILSSFSKSCIGCLEHDFPTNGNIEVIAWDCESCGARLEDIETTSLKRADWMAFGQSPKKCHSCGARNYPNDVLGCSQCDSPQRTEIHDIVLPLVKQGGGKDTSINLDFGQSVTYIDEYILPNGNPLLDGMSSTGDRIFDPIIADIYTTPNFEEIFSIEVTEEYPHSLLS